MATTRAVVMIGLVVVACAACGGGGENVDKEGCMYLQAGPFTPVTAGAAMDASAPSIAAADGAYTVTLPATGAGYLSFASPDDTEYAVFTTRAVGVTAFTMTGTEISPSAIATSSSECTEIMGRYIIELPIASFNIAVGPDAGGPVDLVLRPYNPD
jgi:hypothetical protein